MINQGSKGSLSLFYKDLLIGSYPLTKKKIMIDINIKAST